MDEPEWDRHKESNDIGPCNPLVPLSGSEQVVAETPPRDRLGVILLWGLTRPEVGSLNGEQDVALVLDNRVHGH
jgi:hypothetical protein